MKYPNIEAERARYRFTKSELAERLLISRATYSNWQKGKTEIPCSQIVAMTKLFGVSSDYLLGISSSLKQHM